MYITPRQESECLLTSPPPWEATRERPVAAVGSKGGGGRAGGRGVLSGPDLAPLPRGAAVWLCRRVAVTPEGCVPVKPLLSSLLPKQKVLCVQESGKVSFRSRPVMKHLLWE